MKLLQSSYNSCRKDDSADTYGTNTYPAIKWSYYARLSQLCFLECDVGINRSDLTLGCLIILLADTADSQ